MTQPTVYFIKVTEKQQKILGDVLQILAHANEGHKNPAGWVVSNEADGSLTLGTTCNVPASAGGKAVQGMARLTLAALLQLAEGIE